MRYLGLSKTEKPQEETIENRQTATKFDKNRKPRTKQALILYSLACSIQLSPGIQLRTVEGYN